MKRKNSKLNEGTSSLLEFYSISYCKQSLVSSLCHTSGSTVNGDAYMS